MQDRKIFEGRDGDLPARAAEIGDEFLQGFLAVQRIGRPAFTVFGSARVKPDDPIYADAVEVGRRIAQAGFAVVTGGGPGVMEAANRGAARPAASRSASTSSCRTSSTRTATSTSASRSNTSTRARRCS
jgi:hypothetical protein